jgi:hypothetical protein
MSSENDLENIKSKIKKLLALSKSNNKNEAYIALKKANDFIQQYNIDEDSLRFDLIKIKGTKTYIPWRAVIANAVSWLYGCYSYRNCSHGMRVFSGKSLDAFMAKEMYSYLINTINRCSKKTIRKNAKYKFRRDFKYGMANRLYDRIMELGESYSWSPHRKKKIEEAKNFLEKSVKFYFDEYKTVKLNRVAISKGALYGDGVSLARQTGYASVPQLAAP